jgi:hypothetical protein
MYQAKPVMGFYEFIGAKGKQGGEMQLSYPTNGNWQTSSTDNKIDKLELSTWQNSFPAGTKIEIWGVSA